MTTRYKQPVMIGLTGKRNVGKSTAADIFEAHGFSRVHAFDAGKEAAETYFAYVTNDGERAERMVWGDLKDVPCADLPGGVAPRYFLERFGKFMGVDMGVDWTLAMEIAAARRDAPGAPIVIESVVYEADWFRRQGGMIVRLERPGFVGPEGIESDEAQAVIAADRVVSASTLEDLQRQIRALAVELMRTLH